MGQNDGSRESLGVIVLGSGKGHKWDKQDVRGAGGVEKK
jgi:hypothetical protein